MIRRPPPALLPALLALAAALPGAVSAQAPAPSPPPRRDPAVTSLTLFAGSENGLWRSRTWGTSWERVTGQGLAGLGAVRVVLPVGPRVYVAGDGGLYVSEDFGDTWARTYGAEPALCGMLSRYSQADPTVFLGTPRGLLKSDDGGRTFRETSVRGTPVLRLEWPGPALVVATGQGVLVSTDAGERFAPAGSGLPEGPAQALALSSYYAIDPVLFVGVGSAGVYRSSDGARTWKPAGLGGRTVIDLVWLGPVLYAATDAGLLRTDDGGAHWEGLTEGLGTRRPRRLLFPLAPASGAEAFLGTDGGVFWTGNGGVRWTDSGLGGEAILCLGTFPPLDLGRGRKKK